jgi:hypothetical protein
MKLKEFVIIIMVFIIMIHVYSIILVYGTIYVLVLFFTVKSVDVVSFHAKT